MKRNAAKEPHSLKRNLLLTYFVSAAICLLVGLYNFISAQLLLADVAVFSEANQRLSEIQIRVQALQENIDDYLFSRSSTALQEYYDNSNELQDILASLPNKDTYNSTNVKYKTLSAYIAYYLERSEQVIVAKRNEKTAEYVALYELVGEDYRLINLHIQNIMAAELLESTQQYAEMQDVILTRTIVSYVLFGVSLLLVSILVVSQSNSISRPITKLANYARQVAAGEYDTSVGEEHSSSEVAQLYDSFDVMIENTRLYLAGMAEQQRLENELARQQIESLEKDNLVQQAELQALHAQMAPHFIFNTINIGAKLAMMQGDEVVSNYLETAAGVFRYNLKGLGDASLGEELENVRTYMKLLTIRFGYKLRFSMHVEDDVDVEAVCLPRMTLQPLVENAFVHGVSPSETGGRIRVAVSVCNGNIQIVVANSGEAFPKSKIEALYDGTAEKSPGHLSGIGLNNVIKRLQLQFNLARPVEIFSEEGETQVVLTIPPQ